MKQGRFPAMSVLLWFVKDCFELLCRLLRDDKKLLAEEFPEEGTLDI